MNRNETDNEMLLECQKEVLRQAETQRQAEVPQENATRVRLTARMKHRRERRDE